ncbi:MAG: single-stranded DNA-binding protein [Candidatus Bathyarchaeia archaeon]
MSTSENVVNVASLRIGSKNVNIDVHVAKKMEERQIISKFDGTSHRVNEALVGDESGCILLTLWDNLIDEVQPDDNIRIENGFISLFKGSMRLNVGRYGKLTKSQQQIATVNSENNLSEKVYEREDGYRRRGFGSEGFARRRSF